MKEPSELTLIDTALIRNTGELIRQIESAPDGYLCLADGRQPKKDNQAILSAMAHADILHCGLCFHQGRPFSFLQLCTYNWNFLNPPASHRSCSWKPSIHFMVFEKFLIQKAGGLDNRYRKPQNAIIDLAYRVMEGGGLPVHDPQFFFGEPNTDEEPPDLHDESLFLLKHLNSKALLYYKFCLFFLKGKFIASPRGPVVRETGPSIHASRMFNPEKVTAIDAYTALIPTINRYGYIVKSIESLMKLSFPPAEIVVVDQTPPATRQEAIYKPYVDSGLLKLIFLEKAGQSTARNTGLKAASHPWILLFEDDAEAWSEMVNEHIKLLNSSQADVSTGIVVGPDQDESIIPESKRKFSISDILTTGNAFMSKMTALSAGGFDPAFDHGPGADDDFGKRLYLQGKKIIYNYRSIETHYKAAKGGMREHGAWWRNKATFWGPFPPATQLYVILKYYPLSFRPFLILSLLLKARKKYSALGYVALLVLMPVKIVRSWSAMRKLKGMTPTLQH